MNTYATYQFYTTEYKGTMSEQSFNSYIVKASKDIERNVNRKLNEEIFSTLDPEIQEQISYVACELCDYFYTYGDNTSLGAPESIGLDGVSISSSGSNYSNTTSDKDRKLQNIFNDLPQDWTRYL